MNPAQVRELFTCRDGRLYWRVSPARVIPAGHEAGLQSYSSTQRGNMSCIVRYKRVYYKRSELIWAWHYGEWPESNVFHLDGNNQNDRIENLSTNEGGREMLNQHEYTRTPPDSFFNENGISRYEIQARG